MADPLHSSMRHRLLQIGNGSLECHLEDSSSNHEIEYTALSYSWGGQDDNLKSHTSQDHGENPGEEKTGYERILSVMMSLRSFREGDLKLPQLVVCGEQSAGKSSVLEAISGVHFRTTISMSTCIGRSPTKLCLDERCLYPSSSTESTNTPKDSDCHYKCAVVYSKQPSSWTSNYGEIAKVHVFRKNDSLWSRPDAHPRYSSLQIRGDYTEKSNLAALVSIFASIPYAVHSRVRNHISQNVGARGGTSTQNQHEVLLDEVSSTKELQESRLGEVGIREREYPMDDTEKARFSVDNMPTHNTRHFARRVAEIERNHAWLGGQENTRLKTYLIYGRRGIGKTRIALENLTQHRPDYDTIFCITCETGGCPRQKISQKVLGEGEMSASLHRATRDFTTAHGHMPAHGILDTRFHTHAAVLILLECSDPCLESAAEAQSCFFLMLSRFGVLLPEPEPFNRQLFRFRYYDKGSHAPEALIDETMTKLSDRFIGDEGLGPDTGEPNMGRDDDDDDDCVGFRRFSGPGSRTGGLSGGDEQCGGTINDSLPHDGLRGVIPKFGPPKRDPVAAAIGGNVKRSADETTLAIWRDAIARTCGRTTGFGPMATNKGKETGWKSAWEMHGNARGEGDLMCAY